jgi:hypothetical protein
MTRAEGANRLSALCDDRRVGNAGSRSTADVWLAGPAVADLAPAPRSIIGGGEAATVVRTYCLGRTGLSRLAVSLAVDDATARRFARTCRLETIWRRWVRPAVMVAVASAAIAVVVDDVFHESRLFGPLYLAVLILAVLVLLGRSVLTVLRSRHHPTVAEKTNILIRGADRETARLWAARNPPGAINILD